MLNQNNRFNNYRLRSNSIFENLCVRMEAAVGGRHPGVSTANETGRQDFSPALAWDSILTHNNSIFENKKGSRYYILTPLIFFGNLPATN
jgi:hypothetical protein